MKLIRESPSSFTRRITKVKPVIMQFFTGNEHLITYSDYLLRSLPWLCIPELVVNVQSLPTVDLSDDDSDELQLPRRVVIYSISVQSALWSSSLSSQCIRTTTADPLFRSANDIFANKIGSLDWISNSMFRPIYTNINRNNRAGFVANASTYDRIHDNNVWLVGSSSLGKLRL